MSTKTYITQSETNLWLRKLNDGVNSELFDVGGQRGSGIFSGESKFDELKQEALVDVSENFSGSDYKTFVGDIHEIYMDMDNWQPSSSFSSIRCFDDNDKRKLLDIDHFSASDIQRFTVRNDNSLVNRKSQNLASDVVSEDIKSDLYEDHFYNFFDSFKYMKIQVSSSLTPNVVNTVRIGSHPLQVKRSQTTPYIEAHDIDVTGSDVSNWHPKGIFSMFPNDSKNKPLAPMDMLYVNSQKGLEEFNPNYRQIPRIFVPDWYISGANEEAIYGKDKTELILESIINADRKAAALPRGGRVCSLWTDTIFDLNYNQEKGVFFVTSSNANKNFDMSRNLVFKHAHSAAIQQSGTIAASFDSDKDSFIDDYFDDSNVSGFLFRRQSSISEVAPNDYFQRQGETYSYAKKFYFKFNASSTAHSGRAWPIIQKMVPEYLVCESAYPYRLTVKFSNESDHKYMIKNRQSREFSHILSSYVPFSIEPDMNLFSGSGCFGKFINFVDSIYNQFGIDYSYGQQLTGTFSKKTNLNFGFDSHDSQYDFGGLGRKRFAAAGGYVECNPGIGVLSYTSSLTYPVGADLTTPRYLAADLTKLDKSDLFDLDSWPDWHQDINMFYSGFYNTGSLWNLDWGSSSIDIKDYPTMSIRADFDVPFSKENFLRAESSSQKNLYAEKISNVFDLLTDKSNYDGIDTFFRTPMFRMWMNCNYEKDYYDSWSNRLFYAAKNWDGTSSSLGDNYSMSLTQSGFYFGWGPCFQNPNEAFYEGDFKTSFAPALSVSVESIRNPVSLDSNLRWSDNFGDGLAFPNAMVLPGSYPFREHKSIIDSNKSAINTFYVSGANDASNPLYHVTMSRIPDFYKMSASDDPTFEKYVFDYNELKTANEVAFGSINDFFNNCFTLTTGSVEYDLMFSSTCHYDKIGSGVEGNYGFKNYIKRAGDLENLRHLRFKGRTSGSIKYSPDSLNAYNFDKTIGSTDINQFKVALNDIMANSTYTLFLQYPKSMAEFVPVLSGYDVPTKSEILSNPVTYSFDIKRPKYSQLNLSPEAPFLGNTNRNNEIFLNYNDSPYVVSAGHGDGLQGYTMFGKMTNITGKTFENGFYADRDKSTGSIVRIESFTTHSVPRQDFCAFGSLTYKRVQLMTPDTMGELGQQPFYFGNWTGSFNDCEISGTDMRVANRAHVMGRTLTGSGKAEVDLYPSVALSPNKQYDFGSHLNRFRLSNSIGTGGYFTWDNNETIDTSNDFDSENPLTRSISFPYVDFYDKDNFKWIVDAPPVASFVVLHQGNVVLEHDQFAYDTHLKDEPDNHFVNLPVFRTHFANIKTPVVPIEHVNTSSYQFVYTSTINDRRNKDEDYYINMSWVYKDYFDANLYEEYAYPWSPGFITNATRFLFFPSGSGVVMFDESLKTDQFDESYARDVNKKFLFDKNDFHFNGRANFDGIFEIGKRNYKVFDFGDPTENFKENYNQTRFDIGISSGTSNKFYSTEFGRWVWVGPTFVNPYHIVCRKNRFNEIHFTNGGYGQLRNMLEQCESHLHFTSSKNEYVVRIMSSTISGTEVSYI